MSDRLKYSVALGALLLAGHPPQAHAQIQAAATAEAVTAEAVTAAAQRDVDQLTVVAAGASSAGALRALEDVPKPVSVVTGQDLKIFDQVSLRDALSRLGNVRWNDGNPRTGSFSLRGLTAGAGSDKIDPSVGLTVDGVFYAYLSMAAGTDLVDVQQVNVTRGPQGTEGARHTSVGQINVTTRLPSFTPEASASLTVGQNDALRAEVEAGGPIIQDKLAWRITATRNQQDGAWKNDYPDLRGLQTYGNTDRTYGRAQLLFTPNDNLRVRLLYDTQPKGSEYVNGLSFGKPTPDFYANGAPVNKTNDAIAKLGRRWFTQQSAYTANDYYTQDVYLDTNLPITTKGKGALGSVDWTFRGQTFSLLSSWRQHYFIAGNDDGTPFDISRNGGFITDYEQVSHEAKLTGELAGGFVQYTAGLFHLQGDFDSLSRTRYGNDSGAWNANVQEYAVLDANSSGRELLTNSLARVYRGIQTYVHTRSDAAFAHADWRLSEPLTVTTGFRISHEERRLNEGTLVLDNGYGAALNPVTAGAVKLGGFDSVAFNTANPLLANGTWNPARRDGQLTAGQSAAQLALADAVALQYFGVAPTGVPGEAYNRLTNEQRRQVAAAKAIRLRTFGTLYNQTEAQPWKGEIYTGQLSATNRFNDNLTGYATLQYGEKPGISQFNGLVPGTSGAPRNLPAKKEKTTTAELGVRTNWLNGDLVLNANLFRADIRNFQQTVYFLDDLLTSLNNDGTLYYSSGTGNVAKVRSQGVELDLVYGGIRYTTIRFSGGYTDAKYIDHKFSGQPSENANLAVAFRDVSGYTLANAPKVQFNVSVDYRRPIWGDKIFHTGVNYTYTGKENGDASLSSYGWRKPYGIADLSLGLGRDDGRFDVNLVVRNVFDEKRGDAGWSSYTVYQRPRWAGVVLSGRFL